MSHNPNHNPDHDIDTLLTALRDVQPPADLQLRLLHRLGSAPTSRAPHAGARPWAPAWSRKGGSGWVAGLVPAWVAQTLTHWPIYVPLTSAIVLAALVLLHPHRKPTIASTPGLQTLPTQTSKPNTISAPPQPQAPQLSLLRTGFPPNSTPVPTSTPPQLSPEDQLALEETLAPSLSAPPMPLTAQERLLLRVTRPGSAIEIAELDQLREPILRAAAAARDRASLQRYASSLLAPLAAAESLQPTSPIPPTEPPAPNADPDPLNQ